METTRDRILRYIDFKGENKSQFYAKTGLSNGFLDKTLNPGSDKLDKILRAYPKVNLYWLVTGSGDMEADLPEQTKIAPNAAPISAPNGDLKEITQRLSKLEEMVARYGLENIEQMAINVAVKVAEKVSSPQTRHEKENKQEPES